MAPKTTIDSGLPIGDSVVVEPAETDLATSALRRAISAAMRSAITCRGRCDRCSRGPATIVGCRVGAAAGHRSMWIMSGAAAELAECTKFILNKESEKLLRILT